MLIDRALRGGYALGFARQDSLGGLPTTARGANYIGLTAGRARRGLHHSRVRATLGANKLPQDARDGIESIGSGSPAGVGRLVAVAALAAGGQAGLYAGQSWWPDRKMRGVRRLSAGDGSACARHGRFCVQVA